MQVMTSGRHCAQPIMEKCTDATLDFNSFVSRSYIAVEGACPVCVRRAFGDVQEIEGDGELAFITRAMSEADTNAAIKALETDSGATVKSRIRLL